MPHATSSSFKLIKVNEVTPGFGVEVSGVDFSDPVPPGVFSEIHKAITDYGFLVFRHAGLDDERHVAFARQFGELDTFEPYLKAGRTTRFPFLELFDVSNQEDDGSLIKIGSLRHHFGMGNGLFHVDSSFNPRRAGFSLLRAHQLPPRGYGGNTDFADTRAAYDDLSPDLKQQLEEDYVACHSIMHSRKKAAPRDSPYFKEVDPEKFPFGRHTIVQTHEASGRKNLYIANHMHHLEYRVPRSADFVVTLEQPFERVPKDQSEKLIDRLLTHATQDKYVASVEWQNEGDLVVWDNTCVMHRAGQGTFMEKYARDMRRCTVHDSSNDAWGFNEHSDTRQSYP